MKRLPVTLAAACFALLLGSEVYLAAREANREAQTAAINGIAPDENWGLDGEGEPAERLVYFGPKKDPSLLITDDAELGYRLKNNVRNLRSQLKRGGVSIFDATYSTGRFGWRNSVGDPDGWHDIFFFGDSFLFGVGLNDDQTLPSRLRARLGRKARVHNLGVPFWGVQHIHRLLELGREKEELGTGTLAKAYFLVTYEQLPRLAGARPESAGSPRYEMKNGRAELAGHIPGKNKLRDLCELSALCTALGSKLGFFRNPNYDPAAWRPLFVQLVRQMDELLGKRYRCRLTVLVWNLGNRELADTEAALRAAGLDVVSVSDALPRMKEDPAPYMIPFNGHPSARGADELAEYLAARIDR